MTIPNIRTDTPPDSPDGPEHDACALIMSVRKGGESTYGTLKRAIHALSHMGHRTGFVEGEGDGAGIQTDIPRQLWGKKLSEAGLRSSIATDPRFWVGHCFIPANEDWREISESLNAHFNDAGLNLLIAEPGPVVMNALGRQARQNAPLFIQLAGYGETADVDNVLFRVQSEVEKILPIHFASLSSHVVVYKVRGSVEVLPRFYPDLQDRTYYTAMALCHARYSTNTASSFERVQPFPLMGHNGEINTISRFRQEAVQIGAELDPNNSDSQDIDRTLQTLCAKYGLSVIEGLEILFPPVPFEVENMPKPLQAVYNRLRQSFGPYAQGPAAIIARYANMAVVSVDALGLRPLWFVETEKEFIFSSERGVVPLENMMCDPRPLAPGEKMAVRLNRGKSVEVFDHAEIRQYVMKQAFQREVPQFAERYWSDWSSYSVPGEVRTRGGDGGGVAQSLAQAEVAVDTALMEVATLAATVEMPWQYAQTRAVDAIVMAATGWNREQIQEIESVVDTSGKDLVGSLGHDGPLAVLSKNRVNVADFFKETVAVVTNPAIDREREAEAFSTRMIVGARPAIGAAPHPDDILVVLETPILSGGHPTLGDAELVRAVAEPYGTMSIEDLLERFGSRVAWLTLGLYPGETTNAAINRLAHEAVNAVRSDVQCLVLDDTQTLEENLGWLDPHLAAGVIDRTLREADDELNLRRRAGIVVRSASIRTLHDVILLCGLGADAVNPYAMFVVAIGADKKSKTLTGQDSIKAQRTVLKNLTAGLEKVTSTIGCHELRGYGRTFSSIGLAPSVAGMLNTPNYFGSEKVGLTWERLDREADERAAELRGEAKAQIARVDRFYPKFWKKAEAVAHGEMSLDEFIEMYRNLKEEVPIALRHIIEIKHLTDSISPEHVEIGVDIHDMPLLISAMSFGSQGELAYRAYAEAAKRLNIVCVNGEGGELPDLMNRYHNNRGQQVASGRFGVNAEFLNSAYVIEIKIGQGAKPGEGGMLPASKVSPQVAEARHTTPYVALISPSNNHDLYSIEDLAQLIEELKTVNPEAKVSVKVPVVPGIGVIAVGVAKAGADIINLTGYDGATGAARRHSLQYVGLPTEIGIIQAHRALIESGLRHRVELWCDGGMKTGSDAVKMILLGANRIGFATMAMIAIGCTICRKCHEGTCHVGITTHIKTVEEATEKGLKSFVPRDYDMAVDGIVRVFNVIADEMRRLTAQLGSTCLQDLVGRADLLEQVAGLDMVDLSAMLYHMPMKPRLLSEPGIGRRLTRPRNSLTHTISNLILNAVQDGEQEATYEDEVMAYDRALGGYLAGELVRNPRIAQRLNCAHLNFGPSSIAGNGFAAWTTDQLDIFIEGGAQDGVAKSANGGRVVVMKGLNHKGTRLDGSVGKSFAYGAQRGLLIVQGNADSRACIRLSGADVIFGGEITEPLDDSSVNVGTRANLKGFACEYMTSGRVIIMGDPGPYAFAGMTGGTVYQQLTPEMGFDENTLRRRFAKGATVTIQPLDESDITQLRDLFGYYVEALEQTAQIEEADRIVALMEPATLARRFVKVVPVRN